MQAPYGLGHLRCYCRSYPGLDEGLVEAAVDLGDPRNRCEASVAFDVRRYNLVDIEQTAPCEPQDVVAKNQIRVERLGPLLAQLSLVDSGWKTIKKVDVGLELPMFLLPDTARHENPEVPNGVMERVDDSLVVRENVFIINV